MLTRLKGIFLWQRSLKAGLMLAGSDSLSRLRPMEAKFWDPIRTWLLPFANTTPGIVRPLTLLFVMHNVDLQIPDQMQCLYEKAMRRFSNRNALIEDPVQHILEEKKLRPWLPEEKRIFNEKFLAHPKVPCSHLQP